VPYLRSIAAGFEVRVALIVGLYSVESLIALVTRCTVVVGSVMFGYVALMFHNMEKPKGLSTLIPLGFLDTFEGCFQRWKPGKT
jgi:hypothetical protein